VEHLKTNLSSRLDTVVTQHYRHWESGEDWADVDYEISVAVNRVANLNPYIIIAKSIGTAIAAKGSYDQVLKPAKLILLGVPIKGGVSGESFHEWLRDIEVPVIIVQNAEDPMGSFAEVKEAFEDTGSNIAFVELPGNTHDYLDFDAVAKLI
jgi:predicted alpha/beta-hydrolase family hydrolase